MKNKLLLLSLGLSMITQMIYSQVPSYVPSNGLVGYWPFNGNANDESGNGNNGTVISGLLSNDRLGNANSSYYLNGQTDYITVPSVSSMLPNRLTLSVWVKIPLNYTGNNRVGRIIRTRFYGYILWFDSSNGSIIHTLHHDSAATTTTNTPSNINDNQWHQIVGTFDGTKNKLYLDGQLISTDVTTTLSNLYYESDGPVVFGRDGNNPSSQTALYQGWIDDIAIYNRALSQQEITNMYNGVTYSDTCNAVSGSLVNGLVGYWPFCGNANDQSGNGNNGVVNGATLTTDRFGNSNGAYEFNMNYIKIDNSNIYNFSDNLSVNVWYKISDNMGAITLNTIFVSKHQSSTLNSSYTLYNENNCGPTVYQTDINGNISYLRNGAFCDTSAWHMLTLTFNKPNMIMYLDGIYYSTISADSINQTALPLVFGGTNNSSNPDDIIGRMKGKLDDIGIWNRALTQQEITQLYNQNQCITNISVTDTLIINVGQLSYNNPITYANNITIYPNPASTQVNISFNNITNLTGGNINIINSLGQKVATTPITLSGTNTTMSLDTWGGAGLYFVQILNAQGQILDIKKIILQ